MDRTVAAFSEEQTARLTGVSQRQLRYWDNTQFYRPAFGEQNRRMAFSRVYSFQDIVALRVLNTLRNHFGVTLPHLRGVSNRLSHVGERWNGVKLWVVNKRVVWQEPGTDAPQEVVTKQYVAEPAIELANVVNATKDEVAAMRKKRDASKYGTVERNRYVNHNAPVIAGTRIPVSAIKRFAEAGYSEADIIREYPDLTPADVDAALKYDKTRNVA